MEKEKELFLKICNVIKDNIFIHNFTGRVFTVCQRSFDPFHKMSYFINWLKTSWTHNKALHI